MQYGVPQFINVEDKIVGPFTGKQTICLIVGGGILMLLFSVFDFIKCKKNQFWLMNQVLKRIIKR